jgi:LysM repeat protein
VQPGDSIWRIANRNKVSQDALMRANGISDARKMKTGMKLVIP